MDTKRPITRSLKRVSLATSLVLLVPLVANQFTSGEGWSLFDFVVVGALIMGTGFLFELAARTAEAERPLSSWWPSPPSAVPPQSSGNLMTLPDSC